MRIEEQTAQSEVWQPEPHVYYLAIGGRPIKQCKFSALVLATHFTQLSANIEETAPPWKEFPRGIEVAVVPAQPVTEVPSPIVFRPGYIRTVSSTTNRYYVSLEGSFAGYLKKFRGKTRSNLSIAIRKFKEFSGGEIVWAQYSSVPEMEIFCNLADEVSLKSWQGKTLGRSLTERLGEAQILNWASVGRSQGYILFHQSEPIAYAFCEILEDVVSYWVTGYKPEYREWSPGTVLFYLILERLFAEGKYKLLDFGFGTEPHKKLFSTNHTPCVIVRYFRLTLENTLIAMAGYLLSKLSVITGNLLNTLGFRLREH